MSRQSSSTKSSCYTLMHYNFHHFSYFSDTSFDFLWWIWSSVIEVDVEVDRYKGIKKDKNSVQFMYDLVLKFRAWMVRVFGKKDSLEKDLSKLKRCKNINNFLYNKMKKEVEMYKKWSLIWYIKEKTVWWKNWTQTFRILKVT